MIAGNDREKINVRNYVFDQCFDSDLRNYKA